MTIKWGTTIHWYKDVYVKSMLEMTELRSNGQNPQAKWEKKIQEDIKENTIKITEEKEKRQTNW